MQLQLYIDGQRIEMFKDETVTINSSVQNVKDIGKIFTDYTQAFDVPASQKNNLAFKHWYKPEIEGGFDARTRVDAKLELSHKPFKEGKVELNKVSKKDGVAYSYSLTFYGNVVKLTDKFGEDLLTDLDLSAYTHAFDSDNVQDGIEGSTLLSGNVIYPLISSENVWEWGSANEENIEFAPPSGAAAPTRGLKWFELKPALRLQRIIDAIATKYSVSFTDHFFNSTDFLKLYMWASRDKGYMKAFGDSIWQWYSGTGVNTSNNQTTFSSLSGYKTVFNWSIIPEAGFEDVPYSIIKRVDGVDVTINATGTTIISHLSGTTESNSINIYVQSAQGFSWTSLADFNDLISPGSLRTYTGSNGVQSSTGTVYFSDTTVDGILKTGQLPKIKVVDFLKGIISAFNLVIVPKDESSFIVQTLDEWYDQGVVKDFTKYADLSKESVARPDLNKIINFNYKEPKTILQENFNDQNGVYYSDLEFTTTYEGSTLDIKLPFESILMSPLSDTTGLITDIRVGTCIDKELKPVKTAPVVFYNSGVTTATSSIGFRNDVGTLVSVATFNNVGQENELTSEDITNTLNFGEEVSSLTLSPISASLFSNYWESYITQLYDDNRRLFTFTTYLSSGILSTLQLNDKIVINNRRFLINNFSANLTTGKTMLTLLNDVVPLEILPDTNNGLEYELEFGLEG